MDAIIAPFGFSPLFLSFFFLSLSLSLSCLSVSFSVCLLCRFFSALTAGDRKKSVCRRWFIHALFSRAQWKAQLDFWRHAVFDSHMAHVQVAHIHVSTNSRPYSLHYTCLMPISRRSTLLHTFSFFGLFLKTLWSFFFYRVCFSCAFSSRIIYHDNKSFLSVIVSERNLNFLSMFKETLKVFIS